MAPDRRAELDAVRSLIRQAAPEAEEAVQWGMLTQPGRGQRSGRAGLAEAPP